jgi:UDP-galactopyranose mutase
LKHKKILVVGAGFSGAVLARELVEAMECEVVVIDERDHTGGNCHTERDDETGVMVHKYGPHIFHTSNKIVWEYVNKYASFRPYINRVKAHTDKGVFSLPINLLTINQFFNRSFKPSEAEEYIYSIGCTSISNPVSFEDQALKFLGEELYYNFFKGYTVKQWGTHPSNLPASILKRLPVRFNYDDNYYSSIYQGIPEEGYTAMIRNILDHPKIQVQLNTRFSKGNKENFDHVFYSGPLDGYFDYSIGKLGYRTIYFERNVADCSDFQGNAVINYCSEKVPYTRIHEHKHFTPWEKHEKTVYFKEYSKETGTGDTPYYPKRLEADKDLLNSYRMLAQGENNISFIGRLGTYRYLDMHQVIEESLIFSKRVIEAYNTRSKLPVFPNEEM